MTTNPFCFVFCFSFQNCQWYFFFFWKHIYIFFSCNTWIKFKSIWNRSKIFKIIKCSLTKIFRKFKFARWNKSAHNCTLLWYSGWIVSHIEDILQPSLKRENDLIWIPYKRMECWMIILLVAKAIVAWDNDIIDFHFGQFDIHRIWILFAHHRIDNVRSFPTCGQKVESIRYKINEILHQLLNILYDWMIFNWIICDGSSRCK